MKLQKYLLQELRASNYTVDIRRKPERTELWINVGGKDKDQSTRQYKNDLFIASIGKENTTKSLLDMRFDISIKGEDRPLEYWDLNFQDSSGREDIQPKDKGTAIRLFAALEHELGKLIKQDKPEVFRFRVSDYSDSRFKLYQTIAKKIAKQGTYKLYKAGKQFWFIRKDLV